MATETAPERIYRTPDGDLVPGSDPAALALAYAEGDELTDADAKAWKQRRPPADKQRRAPANKGATPAKKATGTASSEQAQQPDGNTGSGLQVNPQP